MKFGLASIAPVLLAVTIAQLGLGLLTPLIPLLLLRGGASTPVIGLVASAYFVGFLVGALTAARVVLRVGHIRAFAAFAAAAAIMAQLLVFAHEPWTAGAARVLMGYASSGMFLVAESWLNDRADSLTRGRVFGAYQMVNWCASAAGPLALNIVPLSPALFAVCGMAFTAALLPMALTGQSNPDIGRGARLGLRRLFAASPVGVTSCAASGLLNSAFYAMSPVFLRARGFDAPGIAAFLSTVTVAAFVVQYPLGMLGDRIGRRRLTLFALLTGLAAAIGLAVAANAPPIVLPVLGCVLAASTAPLYGLGAGQTNDRLDRADYVAAAGGLLFVWSVGAAIGPTLAGALMGPLAARGLFIFIGVVLAATAGFTLLRMRMREDVPLERQGPSMPAGTSPPRLAELGYVATKGD